MRELLALLLSITMLLAPLATCLPADTPPSPVPGADGSRALFSVHQTSPYCGLVAVFACMNACGRPAPDDLSAGKYVSSAAGSTMSDLLRLTRDCEVPGYAASGLVPQDLDGMTLPAVLHVRTSLSDPAFEHWVAFLGCDHNKYRILDVNTGLTEIDCGSLGALWDGRLLVVGASAPPLLPRFLVRQDRLFLLSVFALSFVIRRMWPGKPFAATYRRSFMRGTCQFCVFGGVAVALSLVYHTVSANGIIANAGLLAPIQSRYVREAVCSIDTEEMKEIVSSGQSVLIDTRFSRDYDKGTIPGAISVPVDTDIGQREKSLQAISRRSSIVVFCQSENCGFADEIAEFLSVNGYEEVCVYRPGYAGWKESVKSTRSGP